MFLLFIIDIAICGTKDLGILRCDLKANHIVKETIDGCNKYISPNKTNYGLFKNNCLTFKTNKTIKFSSTISDSDKASYDQISFYFYENKPAAEAGTIGIASLTILLISSDFNPLTNPNEAIKSQMDNATWSELKLQLNFIAGMDRYAAVVKFKTSTYRSILPGDSRAIFGLEPHYHVTSKIENFYNYFPFNGNPFNISNGTTGYFSIAAGSFIQEQTSEERSNTVLSAIAAAGGAFGTTAATLIFFFGDFRINPRGFAHKFHNFTQNSIYFIKRSRFYSEPELKFSEINDEDKKMIVDEFKNIRYAIYHHLLYQGNMDKKINNVQKWSIYKLENKINILFSRIKTKIYHWLLNAKYTKEMFGKYGKHKNLEFSSINEADKILLIKEINKIRHVIDVYTLGKEEDPEKIAAYKYKRELKFSKNTKNEDKELHIISDDDQKLLNDEFRKIRDLIDKHLLDQPNIEKIFNAYNSLQKNVFPEDMDEDKSLLNDLFQQINHVIFNYLLDIPKDEEKFKEYNKYNKETIQKGFSTKMNDNDKKLLAIEFNNIKHVINCRLFNERKILEVFEKYIKERKLELSDKMSENDKKLLADKFHKIREVIDNFLSIKPTHTYLDFSENTVDRDRKLLSYIDNVNNEIYKIRNDIDKYVLDKV
ncbi:unnamed protein product [Rhizophagus irregularis]|nr:unnamed protein product [Rhizophagus irregularis]